MKRPKNEAMLMTIAAKIAQPIDSILKPSLVKPSIESTFEPKKLLTQAAKIKSAPLMTNEIRPKVSRYKGNAKPSPLAQSRH